MDFQLMTAATLDHTFEQSPASRLRMLEAFRLQITPALANFAVFAPAAFWLHGQGLPVIFALGAGILLGEVPVTWWLMIRRMTAEEGGFSFARAFPLGAEAPLAGLPAGGRANCAGECDPDDAGPDSGRSGDSGRRVPVGA